MYVGGGDGSGGDDVSIREVAAKDAATGVTTVGESSGKRCWYGDVDLPDRVVTICNGDEGKTYR